MKQSLTTIMILSAAMTLPALALGEQQSSDSQRGKENRAVVTPTTPGPVFPPSENCTSFSPCRNVTGEIVRIEEMYWIKDANGREDRVKVTSDSAMKQLPRVGDKITAQVDSTGNVQALATIEELPKGPRFQVPAKTHEDLR